jgi:hypothetical protein
MPDAWENPDGRAAIDAAGRKICRRGGARPGLHAAHRGEHGEVCRSRAERRVVVEIAHKGSRSRASNGGMIQVSAR